MATLQIRVDEKTKKNAKKVFAKLGLDMSSAIKVYLNQVVITQCIPFPLLTENGMTIRQEREILKASEEAKKGIGVTRAKNWKEAKAHLDHLKQL